MTVRRRDKEEDMVSTNAGVFWVTVIAELGCVRVVPASFSITTQIYFLCKLWNLLWNLFINIFIVIFIIKFTSYVKSKAYHMSSQQVIQGPRLLPSYLLPYLYKQGYQIYLHEATRKRKSMENKNMWYFISQSLKCCTHFCWHKLELVAWPHLTARKTGHLGLETI